MLKHLCIALTVLLAAGTTLVSCKKDMSAAAPTGQVETQAKVSETVIGAPPAAPRAVASSSAIPPEAQAAIDALLDVMSAIADTSAKETCAEIVEAIKALDTLENRTKVLSSVQILNAYSEDKEAILEANETRYNDIAMRADGFQKCEGTPQEDEIENLIETILSP